MRTDIREEETRKAHWYAELLSLARFGAREFFERLHSALDHKLDVGFFIAVTWVRTDLSRFQEWYRAGTAEAHELSELDRAAREAAPFAATLVHDTTGRAFMSAIVAPLRPHGQRAGYIAVATRAPDAYRSEDVEVLAAAAEVAGLRIDAADAFEEARARGVETRMLLETARALSSERDLQRLFQRFHQLVATVMEAHTFFIALGERESDRIEYQYAVDADRPVHLSEGTLSNTVAGRVFRDGAPLLMRTVADWAEFPDTLVGGDDHELDPRSAIYVPMRVGDRTVGVISAQSARPRAYTERDRDLLMAIAEQATIAVENSQSILRAEQQAKELQMLAEVSRALSAQLSVKALCQTVCTEVRRVMDAPVFIVALRDGSADELRVEYASEDDAEKENVNYPLRNSLAEQVIATVQPVMLDTHAALQQAPHRLLAGSGPVPGSLIMAPLRLGDQCIGILSAQSYKERAYDHTSVRLLTAIGEQMALAVQNAQLFRDAKNRADRDPLTDLYHHRYLHARLAEEISRAKARSYPLTVMMLDLDNFKAVNDEHGHVAGDTGLKLVTDALLRACRTSDVVGRYGGDEFMLILPDIGRGEASRILERIASNLRSLQLPTPSGALVSLPCSIGTATYPDDGASATDIVAAADANLYERKRQTRSGRGLPDVGPTSARTAGS
ncbi:MAG TPA: diguanylate cyclase [Candidatus Tumulicola sp.]|nr:diguanylate cyclase [Candidatus Tumulicola sp.]